MGAVLLSSSASPGRVEAPKPESHDPSLLVRVGPTSVVQEPMSAKEPTGCATRGQFRMWRQHLLTW